MSQVKVAENRFGIHLPLEYLQLLELYGHENPQGPMFWGIPFVPFDTAVEIYADVSKYEHRWQYWSFAEQDGYGLFVKLTGGPQQRAKLYYTGPGVDPKLAFSSITSLFRAISECWNAGCQKVITEMPFGEERLTQQAILEAYQ